MIWKHMQLAFLKLDLGRNYAALWTSCEMTLAHMYM